MNGDYSNVPTHVQHLSDLFEDRYSFETGVEVKRCSDSPLEELKGKNPERLELQKSFSSLKGFHLSKKNLLQTAVTLRELHSKGSNVSGGMKVKEDHIGFSLAPVKDYSVSIPTYETNDTPKFTLVNRYFRNSLFNGSSYKQEGKTIEIKDACSSCWDRTDHEIPSWRLTETETKESIFYAGRPDTEQRAKIQGIDIFLNELRTGECKGFFPSEDQTIELHYVVDSLTNPTDGLSEWRKKLGAGQALDERKSLEWEMEALKKLRSSKEPIEIEYEGKNYSILLRPMHTHNTVSCMGTFNTFNDTGKALENSINSDSYTQLRALFEKRKGTFNKNLEAFGNEIVARLGDGKNSTSVPVHIRLAMVDMLAKILEVPIVHHCKSVVDRTSGAGAVSVANQIVYEDLKSPKPQFEGKFEEIVSSEKYKNLFHKGLQSQLSVSADLRSAVDPSGELNTKRVLPGFMWHSEPEVQAHGFIPLIPEAGLKQFSLIQKIKNYAKQCFILLIELVFFPITYWLLGLPFVKPTWIKLDKVLNLESNLLSEGGTRPLLEGPANKRFKEDLKKGKEDAKKTLKAKADPLINQLSQKGREAIYGKEPRELELVK